MDGEAFELQQEIVKLRSRNHYLFSLLKGLNTLARAHVHGIRTTLLIGDMMLIGLKILIDSFFIASLNLTLYIGVFDHKIHQTKTRAQLSIRLFTHQIRPKTLHVYKKIRRHL